MLEEGRLGAERDVVPEHEVLVDLAHVAHVRDDRDAETMLCIYLVPLVLLL